MNDKQNRLYEFSKLLYQVVVKKNDNFIFIRNYNLLDFGVPEEFAFTGKIKDVSNFTIYDTYYINSFQCNDEIWEIVKTRYLNAMDIFILLNK